MKNKPLAALGVLIVLAPVLSGCMVLGTRAERAARNNPDFKAGYSDGCASANAQGANYRTGGTVRDDALYKSSQTYRSGWSSGYTNCNSRTNPAGTDPNMGGMPSQRPPGQL